MFKIKLKKALFLILICKAHIGITQIAQLLPMDDFAEIFLKDSSRAIFYRVEVSELTHKRENSYGFDLGERFIYAGDIPHSIAELTNVNIARLRIVGKVPDKHVSYWGERFNSYEEALKGRKFIKPHKAEPITIATINKKTHQENQNDPANIMILNSLKIAYGFTVTDIKDSTEVWIAKVSDSILLSSFVEYENSHGAGPITRDDKKYYELSSWELSGLWQQIELWCERIIYDETGDKKRFSFLVESDKLHDFDRANEALKSLGLYLVKEKRLEKLKLIEFHD